MPLTINVIDPNDLFILLTEENPRILLSVTNYNKFNC